MKKGWEESRWVRVARFKLSCEMGEGRYWEEKYKKGCRICEGEIESWEHVWEECREWEEGGSSWQEVVGRILREDGEGEWWIKKVEKERRKFEGRIEGSKSEKEEGVEGRARE